MTLEQYFLIYLGYIRKSKRYFSPAELGPVLKQLKVKFSPKTLPKIYSSLKKKGFLSFNTYYHHPYPTLSQAGRLAIKTRLPFRYFGDWDQKWRLVIFDIPEKERKMREKFRHELLRLGFRPVQESTYLTAHPLLSSIRAFARNLGINQYLKTAEISRLDDEKKIIPLLWNLQLIDDQYRLFLRKTRQKRDRFWVFHAKCLEEEFAQIYTLDPHLPTEFLPKNWPDKIAYTEYKKIANSY